MHVDFLRCWGGGGVRVFPIINIDCKCFSWRKNELVLKWFLGNFKCFKVMFFSEGCSQNSKFSQFQIFPKLDPRGGGAKFPIFPNSKKSKTSWGREGSRKLWTFSTFCVIFFRWLPQGNVQVLYKHVLVAGGGVGGWSDWECLCCLCG